MSRTPFASQRPSTKGEGDKNLQMALLTLEVKLVYSITRNNCYKILKRLIKYSITVKS